MGINSKVTAQVACEAIANDPNPHVRRMGCDVGCRTRALRHAVDDILAARSTRMKAMGW